MASFEQSLQGKLILDSGKLAGSYFDRAVILICRHDESGTFGLILNRPLKRTLGSAVRESLEEGLAKTPLCTGGPVQPEALSFLQETEVRPEFEFLPWLHLGHSLDELKDQFLDPEQKLRLRAYAGYSGWASGQLDDEVKKGCWIIHPASLSFVFYQTPETLWEKVLSEKGGIYRLLAEFPNNPTLN